VSDSAQPGPSIRVVRSDEFSALRRIEFEAARMFESVGIGPFTNDEDENHFEQAELVVVVGDPPVGFACVESVDGNPHIWQVAVHPDHGRQGLGRALVEASCACGPGLGTLVRSRARHLATVPWNGPFHQSLGFVTMDTLTPERSAIREHERSRGATPSASGWP